jgi:hypothetical protein
MGKNLKYAPNAVIKNFATADIVQYERPTTTPEKQKEKIFAIANECRGGWYPIYSDDSEVLPIAQETKATPTTIQTNETNYQSTAGLTMPPKRKGLDVGEAILLGVGAFIVIKLLS